MNIFQRAMKILFSLSFVFNFLLVGHSQKIDRIEPPFWWTGMKNQKLQLLLYGKDLADLAPQINDTGLILKASHRMTNANYLFIDLEITPEVKSGRYEIQLVRNNEVINSFQYELREREPGSANRIGFNNSDLIYLITPDRFVNGNPENDEVPGLKEGKNRSLEYGRHGGDIQGIIDHLDYFKDMGFTAIWLNPVLENDQPQWSYHGYATTDYYKVDPRFGSNQEYVDLANKASQLGIKLIMDMIVNHCGSEHWWMKDPPSDDWINYYDKPYQETNHRKISLFDPYAAPADRKEMEEGWFVRAMPDLNQRNPFMATYLIQNSIWWIEYAKLAGIRQDTYSYAFREFLKDWTCAIMNEYPDFNIVGEEWVMDKTIISYWQRGKINHDGYTSCLPSLMDFPMNSHLHQALREGETWGNGLIKLYENLGNDYLYPDPNNLVIFPDNHDMSRIFTQLNEDYDLFKMAISYIMTMRGIPQLYYGTEILMSNKGTESHGIIRSDFAGGWNDDPVNAFTGAGLSDQQKEAQQLIRKLAHWRKNKKSIQEGQLMHYVPRDGVYVYFRFLEGEKIMVILNKNKEPFNLDLGRFEGSLRNTMSASDIVSGNKIQLGDSLSLEPRSSLILELNNN